LDEGNDEDVHEEYQKQEGGTRARDVTAGKTIERHHDGAKNTHRSRAPPRLKTDASAR
jgi:hypothetical protein